MSDDGFDDDIDLDQLAAIEHDLLHNPAAKRYVQTTLDGSRTLPQINAVATKRWDRLAYAKSAHRTKSTAKSNPKSRKKSQKDAQEDDNDDDVAQVPDFDPAVPLPQKIKLAHDNDAIKKWIYPSNREERVYQYNIVTKALFTDTLVSLPTGLGKTFIAAVVMLNFYRWFPKGKIIFMAPTRPLVTQQIDSCHNVAGIDPNHCIDLTGSTPPDKRAKAWREKRVIFTTPQTFNNDLRASRLDPTDVICVVVDEAHRATGSYAYCEAVRFMMANNPFFRLLALSATPSRTSEGVQAVIDNLHISHIEVRTDDSIDIRPYIHRKKVEEVIVPISGELASMRDKFGELMKVLFDPLVKRGVYNSYHNDPLKIHPYSFQSAGQQLGPKNKWAWSQLAFLGAMARAVSKLMEQSVLSFHDGLVDLRENAKGAAKSVVQDPKFRSLLDTTQRLRTDPSFEGHPKMVLLKRYVKEHFAAEEAQGNLAQTRIMVFCSFRDVVEEVVTTLNRECGDVARVTRLVGQSTDGKGNKGQHQKEQNEVLRRFKAGEFNVIISTSIGEEGLDIGELDLIICYETPKSAVRAVQRAGRTGRARDGKIIVMMTEGVEEDNWKKAIANYNEVQNIIVSGKRFELFNDSQRLIPPNVKPVATKELVEIRAPEILAATSKSNKRRKTTQGDVSTSGFQTAKAMAADEWIITNSRDPTLETRAASAYIDPTEVTELEEKYPRCKPTLAGVEKWTAMRDNGPLHRHCSRMQINRAISLHQAIDAGSSLANEDNVESWHERMNGALRKDLVITVPTTRDETYANERLSQARAKSTAVHAPSSHQSSASNSLPTKTSSTTRSFVLSSSPEPVTSRLPPVSTLRPAIPQLHRANAIIPKSAFTSKPPTAPKAIAPPPIAAASKQSSNRQEPSTRHIVVPDDDFDDDAWIADIDIELLDQPQGLQKPETAFQSHQSTHLSEDRSAMPPPKSVLRTHIPQVSSHEDTPIIVRQGRLKGKQRAVIESSPLSIDINSKSVVENANDLTMLDASLSMSKPKKRKLRRGGQAVDEGQPKSKRKRVLMPAANCPFLDLQAANSDDSQESMTDPEDIDEELEEDRAFVDGATSDSAPDMAFYRDSLLSQHPNAHRFAQPPQKRGAFRMRLDSHKRHPAPLREDEQNAQDQSQWSYDSFCVPDDEEISVEASSSELS